MINHYETSFNKRLLTKNKSFSNLASNNNNDINDTQRRGKFNNNLIQSERKLSNRTDSNFNISDRNKSTKEASIEQRNSTLKENSYLKESNQALNKKLYEKQKYIKVLESEVKEKNMNINSLNHKLDKLKEENLILKEKFNVERQLNVKNTNNFQANKIKELEQSIQQNTLFFEELTNEFKRKINDFEILNENSIKRIKQSDQIIKDLNNKINSLVNEYKSLEKVNYKLEENYNLIKIEKEKIDCNYGEFSNAVKNLLYLILNQRKINDDIVEQSELISKKFSKLMELNNNNSGNNNIENEIK